MSFLDEIGRKASKMYQDAKDKTSQISNELKLKSKVSEEKDKIANFYSELGKIIYKEYTKNSDGFSNEVANKCREIMASNEAIENLNKEIMALKNTIACTNCGEIISNKSEFCSKCGTAVAKEGKVLETNIIEDNKAE